MAVKRVAALWWLAGCADVEAMGDGDVHMLIRTFRNPSTNDGEILFLIRTRRVRVNKGGLARAQFAVTHNAAFHILRCHRITPSAMQSASRSLFHRKERIHDAAPTGRILHVTRP